MAKNKKISKKKVLRILELLDEHYAINTKCFLDYETPWQLLIATILSAQCTDIRVNIVTKELFKRFPTIEAFAGADLTEMEDAVKTTGFYRAKAKNIVLSMQKLLADYGGEMPAEIERLTEFPGVGRKTANVIRGHIFNEPCIVVDTHVKRVSKRLGLTGSYDPTKIEFELMAVLPKKYWIRYNTQVITHGRQICKAQLPKCELCFLAEFCETVM